MDANWFAAVAQAVAALAAVAAIVVTMRVATTDRRLAAQRAEQDRAAARDEDRRRWETGLLVQLAIAIEPGDQKSSQAPALVFALGPARLPQTCEVFVGDADEQEARIARPEALDALSRARVEVARALRDGLPARTPQHRTAPGQEMP